MSRWTSILTLAVLLRAFPCSGVELVRLADLEAWSGQQFVQADRLGNVYFLNASAQTVYPLTRKGAFGEPVKLETTAAKPGILYGAAMSLGGDIWVLQDARSARVFIDGKEHPAPPLPWKPWSVALLRDVPMVAVVPLPIGGRGVDLKKLGNPPWFLRLGKSSWEPGVELKGISVSELLANDRLNGAIAENAAFLMGDRQGKLWVAHQYAYHVQRLTPGGRPLLDIKVDGGKVRAKPEKKPVEITLRGAQDNASDATKNPRQEKAVSLAFAASAVIEALAEGRDGRVYFFVRSADGGATLDRYDPARAILERVPLDVKLKDRPTMAAGKDGLYLAAWSGTDGRWKVAWEALEQAHWKRVAESEIDGFEEE